MLKNNNPHSPSQTSKEEVANALSHGVALVAAVAAFPALIFKVINQGNQPEIVGATIFGITVVLLYLISTIYHALPPGRAKQIFHVLDHSAIFLLIAGTYTPFLLGALRGPLGWNFLAIIWGLAGLGLLLKAIFGTRYQVISTCLYLCMGWLILFVLEPLVFHVPRPGLLWLIIGGLAYTIGVLFFAMGKRVRYAHFVWHLFVMIGTSSHFIAVMWYAA